jgi:hypothetical protein
MARRSREDTEHLEARADTEELEPGNATSHSGENLAENGEGPRDPYLSVNSNSTQCETVADALNALGHTCDVEVAADGSDNLRRKGKTEEERRADFSRLASIRASNALDALTSLGHLSNVTMYQWDAEQERKIFDTLGDRVASLKSSFEKARIASESGDKRKGRPRSLSIGV